MKKISVIVPVYNTELYIEKCIESLIDQTYQNLEILIINDGSSKDCKVQIEQISKLDNRIKVISFNEKKGVAAARNFGIKKSTGDYIYFLDSDDYLPNKTLQLLIENINENVLICGQVKETHFNNSFAIVIDGITKVGYFSENKKYSFLNRRDGTILNCLIHKDFLIQNNLFFNENIKIYSDFTVTVPVFKELKAIPFIKEALYFKRLRNDPISNPSLNQLDSEILIKDFLKMYHFLKDNQKSKLVLDWLDQSFINFYRKIITPYFQSSENIEKLFLELVRAVTRAQPDILNRYNLFLKKELKLILLQNQGKFIKTNERHQLMREVKVALKGRRRLYLFLYHRIFSKMKIKKNYIFLESFLGKSYSDSPKYIYEYMMKNKMDYKFIWSVRGKKEIPGNAIQVQRFSLRYFYYLARAKYWISNSRLPRTLAKRKETTYLQTWHGTPLKVLVFDMKDVYSADPNYKKHFYHQSRRWDYLSSPNEYSSEIFRRAFKFEKELLEYGYPRNDILYNKNTAEDIENLKENLRIPKEKKVILYAPTWRDDEYFSSGRYKFTLQLDLEQMQKHLSDDYVVLLRMHYFIANQLDVSKYANFVYDFSSYDDIADLYLVSDILITDYSSVFFDYANLKRPILFYTYDLEKYRDKLRGFYIDIENELPGPLLMNTGEIIDSIKNINSVRNEYKAKYEEFYDRFCKWEDGRASEKTVKRVFGEN